MRRGVSGSLVVVALVALAAAAALDAVRSDPAPRPPEPRPAAEPEAAAKRRAPPLERRAAVAAELREAGVRGALILLDESCRYWALELPELEWRWDETGSSPICSLSSSVTTRDAFGGPGKLWEPEGRLIGACRRNLVDVYASERDSFFRMRGCTPAWRPDGRVTYVRGDEVFELESGCSAGTRPVTVGRNRRCGRVVLARADVERAVRAAERPFCPSALTRVCGGPVLRSLEIQDVAWLTSARLASTRGSRGRARPSATSSPSSNAAARSLARSPADGSRTSASVPTEATSSSRAGDLGFSTSSTVTGRSWPRTPSQAATTSPGRPTSAGP